eukprot:Pgem_evm1s6711
MSQRIYSNQFFLNCVRGERIENLSIIQIMNELYNISLISSSSNLIYKLFKYFLHTPFQYKAHEIYSIFCYSLLNAVNINSNEGKKLYLYFHPDKCLGNNVPLYFFTNVVEHVNRTQQIPLQIPISLNGLVNWILMDCKEKYTNIQEQKQRYMEMEYYVNMQKRRRL